MARDQVGGVQFEGGEMITRAIKDKALHPDCSEGTAVRVNPTTGQLELVDASVGFGVGTSRAKISSRIGRWYDFDIGVGDVAGDLISEANPEGIHLVVDEILVHVDTASAVASTCDVGISAGAAISSDNLLDGIDTQVNVKTYTNHEDKGTNGKARQDWPAASFLTMSKATGATAGLVGRVLVHVLDIQP